MAITKVTSGLISADASSIDLNIDAGTLYLDVSENRVGIGTTSPTNALDINGSQVLLANGALKFADAGNAHIGMIKNSGSSGTGQLEFYTGSAPTERMRIDSSGNVLIGTTSSSGSSVKLEAHDATNPIIQVKDTTSNIICGIQAGNSEAVIRCPQDSPLVFNVGASETERMRINASGQVLIGTSTNPTYNHSCVVSGNANIDGVLRVEDIDGTVGLSNTCLGLAFPNDADATSGYFVYMTDSNNNVGSITAASGTSVSFNTTSDERLKKNIVDASSQLDTIKNIQVREFDWKRNDVHEVGVVAQELINIIPDAVHEGGEDEAKNPFGVDYGKIVPYLIKAVQEQQTIIDNLTTRIETLENA